MGGRGRGARPRRASRWCEGAGAGAWPDGSGGLTDGGGTGWVAPADPGGLRRAWVLNGWRLRWIGVGWRAARSRSGRLGGRCQGCGGCRGWSTSGNSLCAIDRSTVTVDATPRRPWGLAACPRPCEPLPRSVRRRRRPPLRRPRQPPGAHLQQGHGAARRRAGRLRELRGRMEGRGARPRRRTGQGIQTHGPHRPRLHPRSIIVVVLYSTPTQQGIAWGRYRDDHGVCMSKKIY
uniref:Uncharacterized protein n=1 Tax=Arundo donax TaxID=35708 RepID=A0A0A8YPK3_ARUDO